jgi:hypothetical protein
MACAIGPHVNKIPMIKPNCEKKLFKNLKWILNDKTYSNTHIFLTLVLEIMKSPQGKSHSSRGFQWYREHNKSARVWETFVLA